MHNNSTVFTPEQEAALTAIADLMRSHFSDAEDSADEDGKFSIGFRATFDRGSQSDQSESHLPHFGHIDRRNRNERSRSESAGVAVSTSTKTLSPLHGECPWHGRQPVSQCIFAGLILSAGAKSHMSMARDGSGRPTKSRPRPKTPTNPIFSEQRQPQNHPNEHDCGAEWKSNKESKRAGGSK